MPEICRKLWILGLVVLGWAVPVFADDTPAAAPRHRDSLVYKDGDRIFGKLVGREDEYLIFKSDRFGELRVREADAVIVPAEKNSTEMPTPSTAGTMAGTVVPKASGVTSDKTSAEAKEAEEQEKISIWEWFSPFVLTAKVRRFFGPWHGKFGITAESVANTNTADTKNVGIDGRLQRKWPKDDVQINARYSYSETNEVTATDLLKSDALWRHDFTKKYFAAYRPTVEWNRTYVRNGLPADYVLLQQEIGGGVNLYNKPAYQVRTGLSENVFTNWVIPTNNYLTQTVESVFLEVEAKLPWRMSLSDRSVYYYSFANGKDGFENKFELDKKFTETLSIGLRYEVRYNNPDVRSADTTLLRMVLGFDF